MLFGKFPLPGSKMKGKKSSCLFPGCTCPPRQGRAGLNTKAINLLAAALCSTPTIPGTEGGNPGMA